MATRTAWGHDGSDQCFYAIKLTSCPRHPGTELKEVTMPKITKFGGPTNAGLTERASGFVEPELTPPADWVRPQNQADADLQAGAPAVDDERTATEDDAERVNLVPAPVEAPFDPADYSVKDVLAELDGMDPAERNAVIEAERAGKGRPGILKA